ncbi:long-chain-fatty-acid--CoA ligase [Actinophytocola glycyrrhizae]|uniref:Long-chain-fatty-acid--CoA ligase n=1 Tax=Actinophytocola glycyrrhizae TaxID=2044873 RepID=A0ABV9S5M8_9PSEU
MPLSLAMVLRRGASFGTHARLVGVDPAGRVTRTWPELAARARRLAAALRSLGVAPGERVGTFSWNRLAHLELMYGVPLSGAVLQPLNVRLFGEQIAWIARHAEDRVVFVDAALTHRLAEIRPLLPGVDYVVLPDGTPPHPGFADAADYEELLAAAPDEEPAEPDEWSAACLCYTSGTTGNPKGVVYTHRSLTLHAMSALFADSFAVRERDVLLPLTPLFHATAWGLPYAAALAGASLVLAGQDTSPTAVVDLVRTEGVTMAAGVPTFWLAVDQLAGADLGGLERILCGGSAIPADLVARYHRRGVLMQQGWGMTEMSPSGNITNVRARLAGLPEEQRLALHATQGLTTAGVELRVVGEDGTPQPHDGRSAGEVEVRGPWVTESYYRPDDDSNDTRFHDGWLRTGDVGTVDTDGYLRVLDRTKDLIKSGGEWISSIELENHLMDHPSVERAAVIAVAHPEWVERPAALVVTTGDVTAEELRDHLRARVARWWVPELVEFVDELPLTATGKFDKRRIRQTWQGAFTAPRRNS